MNKYELTVVLPEKATAAKKKTVSSMIEKLVSVQGGKIVDIKDWGSKELFYVIKGERVGIFLHYQLELESDKVNPVRESLRMQEDISRFLLIRSEDNNKEEKKK